jgi:hypothetical protein
MTITTKNNYQNHYVIFNKKDGFWVWGGGFLSDSPFHNKQTPHDVEEIEVGGFKIWEFSDKSSRIVQIVEKYPTTWIGNLQMGIVPQLYCMGLGEYAVRKFLETLTPAEITSFEENSAFKHKFVFSSGKDIYSKITGKEGGTLSVENNCQYARDLQRSNDHDQKASISPMALLVVVTIISALLIGLSS